MMPAAEPPDPTAAARRPNPARAAATTVATAAACLLIVDALPERLALLHDALEESGYNVRAAGSVAEALSRLAEPQPWPDLVLLAADLPERGGFELAQRLRADPAGAALPLLVMTDSREGAHAEAAFAAGASDVVGKPIRPREVLARIEALLSRSRTNSTGPDEPGDVVKRQVRNALDAFGHASLAVHEADGRCVWQTALARQLMAEYFSGGHFERGRLPPEVLLWLHREALRRRAGAQGSGLTVLAQRRLVPAAGSGLSASAGAQSTLAMVARGAKRLSFVLHAVDPDALGAGQWLIVMREADDAALLHELMHGFKLSALQAELLFWAVKGKNELEIGSILSLGPSVVRAHLALLLDKLGVADRGSAVVLALAQVSGLTRRSDP
jgi:DNA-binding response OmpR family regulator/DNA-binding CsgD family transcriptional regulator